MLIRFALLLYYAFLLLLLILQKNTRTSLDQRGTYSYLQSSYLVDGKSKKHYALMMLIVYLSTIVKPNDMLNAKKNNIIPTVFITMI